MHSLCERRRNTDVGAPGLAALTPKDISSVRRERRKLINEMEAIVPPAPTSLYETHLLQF